jgi:hypothetical protein
MALERTMKKSMTGKERILTALCVQEADRIPRTKGLIPSQ